MASKDKIAKAVCVIGLGRFGGSLAEELENNGVQVLGIDADEGNVQRFSGTLTQAVRADSTNPEVLRELGVNDFGTVVVAIGSNLEASILTASTVLQMGVPLVWCKAMTAAHARILEQLGAHRITRPESEMGRRVAHQIMDRVLDYVNFGSGLAIVKCLAPSEFDGQTLRDLALRKERAVTVVATATPAGQFVPALPDTVVHAGDLLLIAGDGQTVEKFARTLTE